MNEAGVRAQDLAGALKKVKGVLILLDIPVNYDLVGLK